MPNPGKARFVSFSAPGSRHRSGPCNITSRIVYGHIIFGSLFFSFFFIRFFFFNRLDARLRHTTEARRARDDKFSASLQFWIPPSRFFFFFFFYYFSSIRDRHYTRYRVVWFPFCDTLSYFTFQSHRDNKNFQGVFHPRGVGELAWATLVHTSGMFCFGLVWRYHKIQGGPPIFTHSCVFRDKEMIEFRFSF